MRISRRNLPLKARGAFEVAARHCQWRHAAQELGVTHGAVSRQVRQLEDNLGVELFDRSHNRLVLTSAGRRLLATMSDALDRITESTLYLDSESVAGTLVVGSTPSTTMGWLLSVLRDFTEKYPEIELRLVNLEPQQRDLPAEVSVAICFGEPDAPNRVIQELFRERYFPVCSPSLIRSGDPLARPEDLMGYPLIHDQHGRWQRWLARHSLSPDLASQNFYLPDSFQMLEATREGCGIGLADRIEVARELRNGSLVALSEDTVEARHSHYLVTEQSQRMSVRARLFADHLLRQLGTE